MMSTDLTPKCTKLYASLRKLEVNYQRYKGVVDGAEKKLFDKCSMKQKKLWLEIYFWEYLHMPAAFLIAYVSLLNGSIERSIDWRNQYFRKYDADLEAILVGLGLVDATIANYLSEFRMGLYYYCVLQEAENIVASINNNNIDTQNGFVDIRKTRNSSTRSFNSYAELKDCYQDLKKKIQEILSPQPSHPLPPLRGSDEASASPSALPSKC